ncbi:hypothetical protein F503_07689 [Ophiostoma piceae UAMH 11346]|uniref:Uncharacterized protein n=1 Tax=Ophiostoma piceae (strain UAMH 11346) TaxID=1262450 RepID=S3BVE6_OPHP1|nr:hypothetical protein F503_07689 [Ophiostoma piceae UAMH 11346]
MAHRLPPNPIQFVHVSDDLVFKEINTACNAWVAKTLAPRRLRQLSAFVGAALGGTATYIKNMEGCYNLVLQFCVVREADTADGGTASEEQHAVLRLPMPGFRAAALMAEMLQNEVTWLRYFAAHAIAKVPAYLAMYNHRFDKIGVVSDSADGRWEITHRPILQSMHDLLVGVPCTDTDAWPHGPLASAADYKAIISRSVVEDATCSDRRIKKTLDVNKGLCCLLID